MRGKRQETSARDFACPVCGAPPGSNCSGREDYVSPFHPFRVRLLDRSRWGRDEPTRRTHLKENYAQPLIVWLNRRPHDPERKIVWALIRWLQSPKDVLKPWIRRRVDAVLKRCQFRYVRQVAHGNVKSRETFEMEPAGKASPDMHRMIVKVLQLRDRSLLDKIHRCRLKKCQLWFFGGRTDKLFCDLKCKKAHERNSGQYRKRQRKYQADLYAKKKQLAVMREAARQRLRKRAS